MKPALDAKKVSFRKAGKGLIKPNAAMLSCDGKGRNSDVEEGTAGR